MNNGISLIGVDKNLLLKQEKEIERLNNIINEFENGLKRRIKAYEDRQSLGKGYELTNVMEIQLTIDRKYLKELQELKGDGSNGK